MMVTTTTTMKTMMMMTTTTTMMMMTTGAQVVCCPKVMGRLRVHKAGSTTVANILARYALHYDLNIALPQDSPLYEEGFNFFGPFRADRVVPLGQGQTYHVLFNHMRYNRTELDKVMPKDAFYCAIMRLPLSQQKSIEAVEQHIAKLDRELDLVMVTEHFNESVVLLKRRARLQLKDIITSN
nr:hypothetical protein BaRGS_006708 [Batillaria attramentaria]